MPVARSLLAEVPRDAADQHARIDAAVRQQPSGQRRRGRLPVRAGDRRSTARPRGNARGSPRAASSSGSCGRALPRAPGCRARSRCRRRRDRGRAVMCSGLVAGERRDALGGEKVAHRRIDVLIRAADVEPAGASTSPPASPSPCRRRRSDESCRSRNGGLLDDEPRPMAAADDARRDAERQRHRRTGRYGRRKADQHRSGKSAEEIGHHGARRSDSPFGSSQPGSSPMTTADARARMPRLPQLRDHRDRADTAAPRLRRETARSPRRRERERRAERRQQLRQRAAEQHAGCASPRPNRSRGPAATSSPIGSRARQRVREGLEVIAGGAASTIGDPASARERRPCRSRVVRKVSMAVRSL